SSVFGMAQSRKRVYIVMGCQDTCTLAVLKGIAYVVTDILAPALAAGGTSTVSEVMQYTRNVVADLDWQLTEVPPAQ
ncbi:unnamed protein product, partial [Effrenium voratum]